MTGSSCYSNNVGQVADGEKQNRIELMLLPIGALAEWYKKAPQIPAAAQSYGPRGEITAKAEAAF